MTNIPLKFIDNQLRVAPLTSAYRFKYSPINFIIDTGSPKSFVSYGEAIRLKIPINSLSETQIIRMGGSKYKLLQTKEFEFNFRNDQNKLHKIKFGKFLVAINTKSTQEAIAESQNFPSILGTDFFMLNNLFLHFDPNSNDFYIGIKD